MNCRLLAAQEFWAGALFAALGIATILIARHYDMGTTMRMGPGYFPTILGAALVLLGGASCLRAWATGRTTPIGPFPLRAVIFVTISAAAFALLVETAGFAVAVFAASFLACLAGRQFRLVEALAVSLILTIFTALLFVHFLGLPVSLGPAE